MMQPVVTMTTLLSVLVVVLVVARTVVAAPSTTLSAGVHDVEPTEPYPFLHGGAFSGPPVPLSPDPLVRYVWPTSVVSSNRSLQAYVPTPVAAVASPPSSFSNPAFMLPGSTPKNCTVLAPGTLRVEWPQENPAWVEFTSPDLEGPAGISMSISEYDEPGVTASLHFKTAVPKQYGTLFRLELNPQLYEGVKYGWLTVSATGFKPFTLTDFRAVSQAFPTNYQASFSATPLLTKIWYAGAFVVRANLLPSYIGAVLMDRGDRYSWTGDAHVAQATALTVFGEFDYVKNVTLAMVDKRTNRPACNNIATYCLYFVLSVFDLYRATGNVSLLVDNVGVINGTLTDAFQNLANSSALRFVGWDDRIGAGFEAAASTPEALRVFNMVFLRTAREFAALASDVPAIRTLAATWTAITDSVIAALRQDPLWYTLFGIHAAADAINAGFLTPAESSALYASQFSPALSRWCSLSNFNQYWLLQAAGRMNKTNDAIGMLQDCWGMEIDLGATMFWEIARPAWLGVLNGSGPPPIPCGDNGFTSLAHPWSSGCTPFLSRFVLGVTPLTPGFGRVRIQPAVTWEHPAVAGSYPTPHGRVHVAMNLQDGVLNVTVPGEGCLGGQVVLTPHLWNRVVGHVTVNGNQLWRDPSSSPDDVVVPVRPGFSSVRFTLLVPRVTPAVVAVGTTPPTAALPTPPTQYPAKFIGMDTTTSGAWKGKYGRDGWHVREPTTVASNLPAYVDDITFGDTSHRNLTTVWSTNTTDPRALDPPPGSNRTACAWYYATALGVSVLLRKPTCYRVSFYVVDFDRSGRDMTVWSMVADESQPSEMFNVATPLQRVSNFSDGAYLTYEFTSGSRVRFANVYSVNAVVSGLFFDPCDQE